MIMRKTFRSALAKDILRYIHLKQALGRRFENASSVLLSLDGFLSDLGKPPADLTPERFQKWVQTLEPLSSNTKLARMRVVRNFCIYRRRMEPDCFVPDPSQFPEIMSPAAAIYPLRRRGRPATRPLRRAAGQSCTIPSALGGHSTGDHTPLHHRHSPR